MKTILVPTDFSSSARNAVLYSAFFARQMKAKLLLFHSFQVDMPSDDIPVVTPVSAELEKKSQKILEQAAAEIEMRHQVKTEAHAHAGFYPPEEILRLAKKLNPDLVVMGMKQKSKMAEVFIGSTVTAVMRNIKVPLLIIPEKTEFMKPEKILLTFDNSTDPEPGIFSPLRKISRAFNSVIYIVKIPRKEDASVKNKGSYFLLDKSLNGINRVYCFPENDNQQNSVDSVLTKHKAGMIAIVPRTLGPIERIFTKNSPQNLAFHSHIPLLVLPTNYKRNNQEIIKRNSYQKVSAQAFPFAV